MSIFLIDLFLLLFPNSLVLDSFILDLLDILFIKLLFILHDHLVPLPLGDVECSCWILIHKLSAVDVFLNAMGVGASLEDAARGSA